MHFERNLGAVKVNNQLINSPRSLALLRSRSVLEIMIALEIPFVKRKSNIGRRVLLANYSPMIHNFGYSNERTENANPDVPISKASARVTSQERMRALKKSMSKSTVLIFNQITNSTECLP